MKNEKLGKQIQQEVLEFIESRKSLQLSSLTENQQPYASYAPYAIGDECLYVLLSDIAVHANNLKVNPFASVLIIEDEDSAKELFARRRVNYSVKSDWLAPETEAWNAGISTLSSRHGERINTLSQLDDFKLFKLTPLGGRYVKGFGRAYALAGESLVGQLVDHLRDGHRKRSKV